MSLSLKRGVKRTTDECDCPIVHGPSFIYLRSIRSSKTASRSIWELLLIIPVKCPQPVRSFPVHLFLNDLMSVALLLRAPLRHVGLRLPRCSARCSVPDITAPSHHPLAGASDGHCRPNIQVEDRLASRLGFTRVVVDHVAHLLLLPVVVSRDIPVVAVERWLRSVVLEVSPREGKSASTEDLLTQTWQDTTTPAPATSPPSASNPSAVPETAPA
jgi:hypothetical protein